MNKKNRGITLIALVITIIVLIILAGVTIATLSGPNGILTNANEAVIQNEKKEIEEALKLAISNINIDYNTKHTKNELKDYFLEENAIDSFSRIGGIDAKLIKEYKVNGFSGDLASIGIEGKNNGINRFLININNGVILDASQTIANKVNIGDYIDYGIEYENVSKAGHTSEYTGWRVISKENGLVRIISAGTPYTYTTNGVTNSLKELLGNFKETLFTKADGSKEKGINMLNQYGIDVVSVRMEDISFVMTGTYDDFETNKDRWKFHSIAPENGLYPLYSENQIGLIDNHSYFWLATAESAQGLWLKYGDSTDIGSNTNSTNGIRPVVTINQNVKISNGEGTKENPYQINF